MTLFHNFRWMKPRLNLSTFLIVIGIIALTIQGIKAGSHVARCKSQARDFAEAEARCQRALAWELERPAILRAELESTLKEERLRLERDQALTRDLIERLTKEVANDPKITRKLAPLEAKLKQRRGDFEAFCAKETARFDAKIRESRLWVEKGRLFAAYQARMKVKYQYAAAHPWRTIPPDDPMPTWTYHDLPRFQQASSP